MFKDLYLFKSVENPWTHNNNNQTEGLFLKNDIIGIMAATDDKE